MPFPPNFSDGPVAQANEYTIGSMPRASAVFTVVATGAAMDPDVVNLTVTPPSGPAVEYVYGTDVELVKDSTGNYHLDIDANLVGTWTYKFWSTGNGQAAKTKTFTVVA